MKLFSVSFLLIALLIELSGAVQATDYAAGPLGRCP